MNLRSGFSLIELTVVIAILAITASLVTVNFSSVRVRQELSKFAGTLRRAQSLALSGSGIQDNAVCGYGLHFLSQNQYILFEGRTASGLPCGLTSRLYKPGIDRIVETFTITAAGVVVENFPDVFFEPPDPKVYLADSSSFGSQTAVYVRRQGDPQCSPSTCLRLIVSTSGRIEITAAGSDEVLQRAQ